MLGIRANDQQEQLHSTERRAGVRLNPFVCLQTANQWLGDGC